MNRCKHKYKQLKVPEELHKALKTAAAKEGLTMIQYLTKLSNKEDFIHKKILENLLTASERL